MSAWLVSKAHIDALTQAAAVEGVIPFSEATKVGRMLWRENRLSLLARYGDHVDEDALAAYSFEGIEAPLDDAVIHHNIGCYDYQSCEHDEWRESEACALVTRLAGAIGARHPEWASDGCGGVRPPRPPEGLPWGIDHISQAVAHSEVPR